MKLYALWCQEVPRDYFKNVLSKWQHLWQKSLGPSGCFLQKTSWLSRSVNSALPEGRVWQGDGGLPVSQRTVLLRVGVKTSADQWWVGHPWIRHLSEVHSLGHTQPARSCGVQGPRPSWHPSRVPQISVCVPAPQSPCIRLSSQTVFPPAFPTPSRWPAVSLRIRKLSKKNYFRFLPLILQTCLHQNTSGRDQFTDGAQATCPSVTRLVRLLDTFILQEPYNRWRG